MPDIRSEIDALFVDYCAAIDDMELERWPELFCEDGLYKIISRENFDRGLPLATMLCESRRMMADRVVTMRQTQLYAPRHLRHIVGNIRVGDHGGGGEIAVRSNFLVLQTLLDRPTEIFSTGRYLDKLVRQDGRLMFSERICVFDTVIIPNSLIFPL
ncbi:MAG: aromatic-ring-hydroxylating dioxygenase subunit beta [Alphaproteobacteria bacterium]|nr:aromatic-ring-hydroxylating dioxygenase subunit beta [Alphaproteobacteria bacterium]